MLIELAKGASLLLAVCLVQGFIARRWRDGELAGSLLSGLLFGGACVLGMAAPIEVAPGHIADARSVVASMAGLFGGPVVGAVTALVAGGYRLWLGGGGAPVGIAAIVVCVLLGLAYRHGHRRGWLGIGLGRLLAFGLLVHLLIVSFFRFLPEPAASRVMEHVAVPFVLVFAPATALLGLILRWIEEQVRTERTLAESERRFRDIAENTSDWIWETGPDLRFTYFSRNDRSSLRHDYSRRIGTRREDCLPRFEMAENREKWAAHFADLEARRPFRNFEYASKAKDGGLTWARISGSPVFAPDGTFLGYRGTGSDITAERTALMELKKANEVIERERSMLARRVADRTAALTAVNEDLVRAKKAAEDASRAKSAFLATISHEIRTPMNGVLGAMELLDRAGLDDGQSALLQTARGSARSLLGLLNDLLDMAKIEAGRIEILPAPASLERIVGQVLSTHLPSAISKGIGLASRIAPGVPPWLAVDGLRVRQILGNLVSNATKFTSRGGVELIVESAPLGGRAHRVRFIVRDTGAGIPAGVLQTLFRPFEQGTAELARQSGGTGLGLAICRGLAERMGGSIGLESEPGRGTTATLELPLAEAEPVIDAQRADSDEGARAISAFVDAHASTAAGHQVLVVDDHPVNRQLLVKQLAQLGLAAEHAGDGVEALEKLRAGKHALVITDCEMPRMNGFALARAIRRSGERFGRMPVIACTAHALPEVAQRCAASGMNEVLTKPIDLAQLARTLRKWWPAGTAAAPPAEPVAVRSGRAPQAAGGPPVLDARRLEGLTSGDKTMERELVKEFGDDTRQTLAALSRAIADNDLEESRRLAHRGKGACQLLGALALADAFGALEQSSAARTPVAKLLQQIRRLQHENRRLERALGLATAA